MNKTKKTIDQGLATILAAIIGLVGALAGVLITRQAGEQKYRELEQKFQKISQQMQQERKMVNNNNINISNAGGGNASDVDNPEQRQAAQVNAPQGTTSKLPASTQQKFDWLEEKTPMAFYSVGDSGYGTAEGWSRKWEKQDKDNRGESYEHGMYFAPASQGHGWANIYPYYTEVTYSVDQYKTIAGYIVLAQKSKNHTDPTVIDVYFGNAQGDVLKETIPDFNAKFSPWPFSYDVSSADRITFHIRCKDKNERMEQKDFGLVDAKLYY